MKKFLNILLSLIISISASSCGDQKTEDTWVVGISADNPPYTFVKNGEFNGFEIDLIKNIAQIAGKKIELQNMEFHTLIAALNTGKVDMVIAGMTVNEDRLKRVDFSKSYASTNNALLHKKESGIKTIEDLEKKKIGVLLASAYALVADDISRKCSCETVSLSNTLILVEELKSGRIDVVILEKAQAEEIIKRDSSLDYFLIEGYNNKFAIALTKDNKIKINIDEAIAELHKNKVIEKLLKQWGLNDTNE